MASPEKTFDVDIFNEEVSLAAVRVPARAVKRLQRDPEVRALIYRRRGVPSICPVEGSEEDRIVLLKPEVDLHCLPSCLAPLLDDGCAKIVTHELKIGYEHATAEEALRKLLPPGVTLPRAFETVGHLAHVNLRDDLWPYRRTIGQVLLDKNPCIQTVAAKVGTLSNAFRTFDMEIIAGRDDTEVRVCESGLGFHFDFRAVYWNSRLGEERARVLKRIEPSDIVCDLFAGVGALALMCARKGAYVYANDLNPSAASAIRSNSSLNKLAVVVTNLCARDAVRGLADTEAPENFLSAPRRVNVIMNLPEHALEFLDVFKEMLESRNSTLFCGIAVQLEVYAYAFARDKAGPDAEVFPRLVSAVGFVPDGVSVREVRDVSPRKNMFCVEFSVCLSASRERSQNMLGPAEAALASISDAASAAKRARAADCVDHREAAD